MQQPKQTLKQSLTTTLILWGVSFLVAVVILFFTFSNSIELYIIEIVHNDNLNQTTLSTALGWISVFVLTLLLITVKGLHHSLNRQLVEPVEELRLAIEEQSPEREIQKLIASLPYETSRILSAHDQLKSSHSNLKERMLDMMEQLPACIWWSNDGKTYAGISSKAESVLHVPAEAFNQQPLWAWTNARTQKSSNVRQLQQAIENKQENIGFAYQVQIGEQTHWYGESLMICYNSAGKLDIIYGTINDISTRKNRQRDQAEQLELAHRLETTATLVGGIAHEFNNALAGMNGNVFLIKQSISDKETLLRIHRIEKLIERSASMIDHMLAFARKSSTMDKAIDLTNFFTSLQSTIIQSLPNRAQFSLLFDDKLNIDEAHLPIIQGDQKKLQEVVLQLIQNACFAVQKINQPHINITLKNYEADELFLRKYPQVSSRHLVHIQVYDNGSGIAKELQQRIFEPFFTTREIGQGTGLGLSMVYGYIQQIGGIIDVESSHGQGTVFHIYLPRIAAPRQAKQKRSLQHGNGETIMVVDDDQVFRESTCEVLKRMGYNTIEARSGKVAIELFSQQHDKIQLILMDILMPGMTGIQSSRRIRQIESDIPIIFLTGYDRTQPLEPEVYEKNSDLINKPFRITALSHAIQKVITHSAKH